MKMSLCNCGVCNKCYKKAYTKLWRWKNKAYVLRDKRLYHRLNYKRTIKRYKLRAKYNISQEFFDAMVEKQSGLCAICFRLPTGKMPLCVDHDHRTMRVRGLLCTYCNSALGLFDDPSKFERTMEYLYGIKI